MIIDNTPECPFCGEKLIVNETRDSTIAFVCPNDKCMAEIRFAPILFGQPIPVEEALRRIKGHTPEAI
jgi:hypothetical protein